MTQTASIHRVPFVPCPRIHRFWFHSSSSYFIVVRSNIMSDQESNSNNNSTKGGNDDLSGLSSFFFYIFIVHPVTAWILRPGRFERRKSILYAIAFLAGLAAIKTGMSFRLNRNTKETLDCRTFPASILIIVAFPHLEIPRVCYVCPFVRNCYGGPALRPSSKPEIENWICVLLTHF